MFDITGRMRLRTQTWVGTGGVVASFVIVAALIAAFLPGNFRVHRDEESFHLPTVRQFQEQWPHPDIRDYPLSTAPGYHLTLAAAAVYLRDDLPFLRLVGSLFSVAFIAVAAMAASRRAAWLALPLAFSVYVQTSTVWLLSENAAWLWVLIAVLLAMDARGRALWISSAVVLALVVFFRQSQAWVIGVFAVAAVTQNGPGDGISLVRKPSHWLFAMLAMLPAVAVLGTLVVLWHGMVPPSFQPGSGQKFFEGLPSGGFAPGAPAFMLTLIGGFGLPLLAWLWPEDRAIRPAVVGAVIGLILGLIPASSYVYPERYSGYWPVIQKLPTFADRSPLFVAMAIFGGAIAAAALWRHRPRQRLILGTALAGMTAAQMLTPYLWQRYYEPFVLIWLMLVAAEPSQQPASPRRRTLQWAGLGLLTLAQLAICYLALQNNR